MLVNLGNETEVNEVQPSKAWLKIPVTPLPELDRVVTSGNDILVNAVHSMKALANAVAPTFSNAGNETLVMPFAAKA